MLLKQPIPLMPLLLTHNFYSLHPNLLYLISQLPFNSHFIKAVGNSGLTAPPKPSSPRCLQCLYTSWEKFEQTHIAIAKSSLHKNIIRTICLGLLCFCTHAFCGSLQIKTHYEPVTSIHMSVRISVLLTAKPFRGWFSRIRRFRSFNLIPILTLHPPLLFIVQWFYA